MPTVPRYSGRQVATSAIPGARKTAAETQLSTGAGLEQARSEKWGAIGQVGAGLFRVGGVLGLMAEQERERADNVAVLSAENELRAWEQKRLYDPQAGALTVKGKDSFGLPEQVGAEFTQLAGRVEQRMVTRRQRDAFQRVKLNQQAGLDLTLRRHVYGEMQRYEASELESLVVNARDAAIASYNDPKIIGMNLARGIEAIEAHAPNLGLGPEQVARQVDALTTSTHAGVIQAMLANDETGAAQVYYEETKSQIKGDAVGRIEKALAEGKVRKEAQTETQRILGMPGLTLAQQREQAKRIDDPEVQDAVLQRLEHEATVRDRVEKDQHDATLRSIYDRVDKGVSLETLLASREWAALDGNERNALRIYHQRKVEGLPVKTDDPTYYALMQQAADDPQTFVSQNLLNYRHKLGDSEFKSLAGLQLSIKSGDRKAADKELAGFRTKDDLITDALAQYKIETRPSEQTPAQKAAIAQLRRMLDARIDTVQAEGRKVTNTEIQKTLDAILSQSTTVPGSWWNIFPGGKPFYDQQKRLIDLTIDDVPAEDRRQIEQALRRRGRPVSDATILDRYIEGRMRGIK